MMRLQQVLVTNATAITDKCYRYFPGSGAGTALGGDAKTSAMQFRMSYCKTTAITNFARNCWYKQTYRYRNKCCRYFRWGHSKELLVQTNNNFQMKLLQGTTAIINGSTTRTAVQQATAISDEAAARAAAITNGSCCKNCWGDATNAIISNKRYRYFR
jgi:hypothetical protein